MVDATRVHIIENLVIAMSTDGCELARRRECGRTRGAMPRASSALDVAADLVVHEAIRVAWEYVRMVVAYGSARDRAPQAGRGRRAIPRRGDHADPNDQPSYVPKSAIAAHRSPNTLKDNMITKTAYFFIDNSGYPRERISLPQTEGGPPEHTGSYANPPDQRP
jgi:hypothetical protein